MQKEASLTLSFTLVQRSLVASTDGSEGPISYIQWDKDDKSICTLRKRFCKLITF